MFFYKETDSIIIKQKTTENKRAYDGELMEMGRNNSFYYIGEGERNAVAVRCDWK